MNRPQIVFSGAVAIAIAIGTSASVPAFAQQEGIYGGQTTDGSQIAVQVVKDGNGFDLLGATVAFLAKCNGDKRVVDHAWGFVFADKHPIVDGKVSFDFHFWNVDIASRMTFDGTESVTGTVETRTASLARKGVPAAEYCISPEQGFSATFLGGREKSMPRVSRETIVRGAGLLRRAD